MLLVSFGCLSLFIGFIILLLPLLLTELSRPRDSILGALFLVLGLVLFLDNDRFQGSPMLVIISGALVIAKIGLEVSQFRWQNLSLEEKLRIGTFARWIQSFKELALTTGQLVIGFFELFKIFAKKQKKNPNIKKWVLPELEEVNLSKSDAEPDKKGLPISNQEDS